MNHVTVRKCNCLGTPPPYRSVIGTSPANEALRIRLTDNRVHRYLGRPPPNFVPNHSAYGPPFLCPDWADTLTVSLSPCSLCPDWADTLTVSPVPFVLIEQTLFPCLGFEPRLVGCVIHPWPLSVYAQWLCDSVWVGLYIGAVVRGWSFPSVT